MTHTITELAAMAGLTTRTLRHYDAIGLLKPSGATASGTRTYATKEIDRLQQILLYRELGLPLRDIRKILDDPAFDPLRALQNHRMELQVRKSRIEALIDTVDRTLLAKREGTTMKDEERFKAMKDAALAENERKYGAEARARYGDETVAASNARFAGMDKATYERMQTLGAEIIRLLLASMQEGDVASATAQLLVAKHREWLMIFWPTYAPEAHRGLADTYVSDPRFRAFYDQHRVGAAQFLRDAIHAHAK